MNLSHYSDEAHIIPRSVAQGGMGDMGPYSKPQGLWLSVDGDWDWKEWCEAEDFGIGSHRHVVELIDDANVLVLSSAGQLRAFTKAFGELRKITPQYSYHAINWASVAEKYDGLIIAPYIGECRLNEDTRWYYTWDCASGCIWNAQAIKSCSLTF